MQYPDLFEAMQKITEAYAKDMQAKAKAKVDAWEEADMAAEPKTRMERAEAKYERDHDIASLKWRITSEVRELENMIGEIETTTFVQSLVKPF